MKKIFFLAFIFITSIATQTLAQRSVETRIPSDVGGTTGLFLRIEIPTTTRYTNGAPIVIHVPGGFNGAGLGTGKGNLVPRGFIEINFNFPGSGSGSSQSGGTYDTRGEYCIKALRDIIKFALGSKLDLNGKNIDQLVDPTVPLKSNVGIAGWSNGGNATTAVAGIFGKEINSLAWIVNWESPVGDGMPGAECGSYGFQAIYTNPILNPAYNSSTGIFDTSTIAYNDTIIVSRPPTATMRGGLFFDINKNNRADVGIDFFATPIMYQSFIEPKVFYSHRMMREATRRNLIPLSPPMHMPDLNKTTEFWKWRNGEFWIDSAKQKIPSIMFLVVASDTDHVQSAPDHPHVLIQYEKFRSAGTRLVRLNPDRSYVEYILGRPAPSAKDNPALTQYDHNSIRNAVEPSGANGFQNWVLISASACELADRTYYNNVQPQLNGVLTSVENEESSLKGYSLYQNFPNPFNLVTRIKYSVLSNEYVKLKVFDVFGREIETLVDEMMQPGEYDVKFGNDNLELVSGVYYYQLQVNNFVETKKMILLK